MLREAAEETSDAFIRIAIPNEQQGFIEYHTYPVLPKMDSSKLTRVIAHQFAITNPEDFGLSVFISNYSLQFLQRGFKIKSP